MERLVFQRSDVESILRTVQEAGRALAAQQPDVEYLRGYATALRLMAAAFGVPEVVREPCVCDVRAQPMSHAAGSLPAVQRSLPHARG